MIDFLIFTTCFLLAVIQLSVTNLILTKIKKSERFKKWNVMNVEKWLIFSYLKINMLDLMILSGGYLVSRAKSLRNYVLFSKSVRPNY